MTMVKRTIIAFALLLFPLNHAMARDSACLSFDGAVVIDEKGKYLGKVANKFQSDSIFNEFGKYGNKFNPDSIWNEFGVNGNPFNPNSWSNEFSSSPPRVIKGGRVIAVLSVNTNLPGAITPVLLGALCYDYEPN